MLQSNMSLMPFFIHSKLFKKFNIAKIRNLLFTYTKTTKKKFQKRHFFIEHGLKISSERGSKVKKIFKRGLSSARLAEDNYHPASHETNSLSSVIVFGSARKPVIK